MFMSSSQGLERFVMFALLWIETHGVLKELGLHTEILLFGLPAGIIGNLQVRWNIRSF